MLKTTALIKGVATYFLPNGFLLETGGTSSARYCYSVWLRHLVLARQNGLRQIPATIAELGPGDSTGIGMAGLLSGATTYYAFDAKHYAIGERNLAVFDQLVDLFRTHAGIPGEQEFPFVVPRLPRYDFPSEIFPDSYLNSSLSDERVSAIRRAVLGQSEAPIRIRYYAPWDEQSIVEPGSVDFILSQAVLEHVDDLPKTYRALHRWLKADGIMSHQIDFSSHGTSHAWNGHWAYSPFEWRLVRGKRSYLLNREPHSTHLGLLRTTGFDVLGDFSTMREDGIARKALASRFITMSDDDLRTDGAYIIARKTAPVRRETQPSCCATQGEA